MANGYTVQLNCSIIPNIESWKRLHSYLSYHIFFISSYLRISPNSWIIYNFLSPSKQSNPTPTFPGVYSVPRFQRPRPMELRTGRRGRRGSRSSRSFQRSTFQRPLLHLENSQGIPLCSLPKKKVGWKMCLEFASFFHFMYVFVSVRRDVYGVCSSACFDKCKNTAFGRGVEVEGDRFLRCVIIRDTYLEKPLDFLRFLGIKKQFWDFTKCQMLRKERLTLALAKQSRNKLNLSQAEFLEFLELEPQCYGNKNDLSSWLVTCIVPNDCHRFAASVQTKSCNDENTERPYFWASSVTLFLHVSCAKRLK